MAVSKRQRFTKSHPCPIYGGYDQAARGKGQRCWGYLSDDNAQALCARMESAGPMPYNYKVQGYWHKLQGPCGCGVEHGPRPAPSKGKATTNGRIVATYDYLDETGQLLHQTVRYEPKGLKQRRPDGNGGWVWDLKGIKPVLYCLPELRAGDLQEVVLIPEGEKDVESARSLGYVATCNPMGAGKWRDSYSQDLAGQNVVIIADVDPPGRRHAQQVAASLKPLAASVKVLEMPGPGKDISDWLALGHRRADLDALIASAPLWRPSLPRVNGSKPDAPHAQADATEHYTDLGLARRLVAWHGQDMRYVWPLGKWLTWTGQRGDPDDSGRIVAWAKGAVAQLFQEAAELMREAARQEGNGNEDTADKRTSQGRFLQSCCKGASHE